MAVYLVSYDLRQPGRNYEPLWQDLRNAGGVRALESLWLVDVNQTAVQVRDLLRTHLDANDRIMVVEITPAAAWAGWALLPPAGDWIKGKRP